MKRAAELFTFDEPHLIMYPLTRGACPRLFPEEARARTLSLAACEAFSNGVVYLNYRAQA